MRRLPALPLLATAAGLAACTTTSSKNPERVQTTSQAVREDFEGAVTAPLRDLNVLRTKIPQVLLEAMADPYYRPPGKLTCDDLIILLTPIDEALGPDLDEPPPAKEGMTEGVKAKAPTAAYGLVAGVTRGAVPFNSWIRKLTGAERHDSYVQQAITAGGIRRGYLKGLGEAKSCPPPAIPTHVRTGSPVMSQELRARFPTKLPPEPETPHETHPGEPPR